jgi:hypothetical protein
MRKHTIAAALMGAVPFMVPSIAAEEGGTRPPERAMRNLTPELAAVYERFKALAGQWRGKSTKGWTEHVTFRLIAAGSAVLETSFDAHPNETMMTFIHPDGARLLLTHYCVAQSQPRLTVSAVENNGKTVHFVFLDGTNLKERNEGHMDSVVYTFADKDHFTSRWSWYQDGKEQWGETIEYERLPAT